MKACPYLSQGNPKGVELSHKALATNMKQIVSDGYCQTRFFEAGVEQDRFQAILPFFHMYGFHVIMSVAIFQGAFVTCLPKFEPETYLKALVEHKVI